MTIQSTLCCALALGLAGVGLTAGCGVPAYDMFEQSQAEMASEVGEWCGINPPPQRNEVNISDQPEACGDFGKCLGVGPEHDTVDQLEMCSCRCDGDLVDAPFCACPEGYVCQDLVSDLREEQDAPHPYAGSYCAPAEQMSYDD